MSRQLMVVPSGRRVEVGARVTFEGRTWQVNGVVDGRVHLAADDGATGCVLAALLVAAEDFAVVGRSADELPAAEVWQALPLAARERALAWLRHIREIETGLPGGAGSGGEPNPEYDPRRFTLAEREQAKAAELAALGWTKVGRNTVQRRRLAYHKQGLMGLVDQRTVRPRSGTGRADERVVAAVLEALRDLRGRKAATGKQVIQRAERIVGTRYGPGRVKMPSAASMYRLVKALSDPAEPLGSPARTANGSRRSGGPPSASRPAERVHVSTARLGARVVGEDGRLVAVSVTAAVDEATGCVLAAVLHPQESDAQLPVLLAEMAVPRPLRAGWPGLVGRAHEGWPCRLLPLQSRIEATAARPAAVPETLVLDAAGPAVTSWFLTVCEDLGVSVELARKRGHSAPGVLAGAFTRYAAGLADAARPVAGRGEDDAGAAGGWFSLPHLQDLLDEWVTARWHTRPQKALRHPLLSAAPLTPDEMWRVLLGATGAVPLPLSGRHFAELLPVRRAAVTEAGVRLGRRLYDEECLNEHRGRSCPTTDDGRWEVHHHPHDVRQVWIRLPDGLLYPLCWTDQAHVQRPFDATVHRRITHVLAGRRSDTTVSGAAPGTGAGAQAVRPRSQVDDAMAVREPGNGPASNGTVGGGQEFGLWDAQAQAGQW
ncbi:MULTISPECIES: Mu transposase C-terminal domain-containing protein [unclassified Streptomyces]|uniref:Mu transposase C-terminal domain-containing protein n=1 Tax=unclassified Streptomyces TaxID=2593676 RepID=UPI00114664C1|nr:MULTISPECIES: Mu transposase C-terminal domain-containing protein [unclassified Streptomyces]MYR75217.1 transposase [Streptomyces sp. SID4925]